jgi:hypothetical protein
LAAVSAAVNAMATSQSAAAASATASATSATSAASSAAAAAATEATLVAGLSATSTTSATIGTGSLSITVQTGKLITPGMFLLVSGVSPANYMHGTATSYNSSTGALVLNVTDTGGSGTFASWTVTLSGTQGPTGGVASIAGNTGAFTLGNGIKNSTNVILADPSFYQSYLAGLQLSNDGTLPNAVIDISAGVCTDSTNATFIKLGAFTKNTGGTWIAPAATAWVRG